MQTINGGKGPAGAGAAIQATTAPTISQAAIDLSAISATQGVLLTGTTLVVAAGDVNGDGIADVVDLARAGSGNAAYIIYGHAQGVAPALDVASLNASEGFTLTAPAGFEMLSVASAGDVNHDGVDDLIIGGNLNGNGGAYVVYGVLGGPAGPVALDSLSPSQGFKLRSNAEIDSVASAGDVNGDGYADLFIGIPNEPYAFVIYGASTAPLAPVNLDDFLLFNPQLGLTLRGGAFFFPATGTDHVGSVAPAGDVNGDGFPDLIVGNPSPDSGPGGAYVVYGGGGNGVLLASISPAQGFRVNGPAGSSIDAGYSVASAGDVNGDGLADIIIGAPYAHPNSGTPGSTDDGAAYVIYGQLGGITGPVDLGNLAPAQGFEIDGPAGGRAGISVAGIGDVNGDGFADIIIGAPGNSYANGAAYVVFGQQGSTRGALDLGTLDTAQGFGVISSTAGGYLGTSVSGAGDFNADGVPDFIVNTVGPLDVPGASYIVYGQPTVTNWVGTPGDDIHVGGPGSDYFQGLAGDDQLTGGPGNDTIDGGDGFDTAYYDGAFNLGSIIYNFDGSVSVTDTGGTDLLRNVEQVNFSADPSAFYQLTQVATPLTVKLAHDDGVFSFDNISTDARLTGSGRRGTLVTVHEGTTLLGTTVADLGTAVWSFSPVGLAPGAHEITVSQTDGAGVTQSAVLDFTIGIAPTPILIATVTLTSPTGATYALDGTADPGAAITIQAQSVTIGATVADANGAWSFLSPTALAGTTAFSATAVDADGNSMFTGYVDITPGDTGGTVVPVGYYGEHIVGGSGNDILHGGFYAQTLTGGLGADEFVFDAPSANVQIVTDFGPTDTINLQAWIASSGILGDPIALGYARLRADGADTVLDWNQTAAPGDYYFIPALRIVGVPPSDLSFSSSGILSNIGSALPPLVSISGSTSATEGTPPGPGGVLVFQLSRTGDLSAATTLTYSVGGSPFGNAATADDLASGFGAGSVTFASGDSSATISLAITPDAIPEPDEQVQLSLLTVSGGVLGNTIQATAAILNDDGPVPTPTIVSITAADDAIEGSPPGPGGMLMFHLGRSGDLSGSTIVTYSVGGSPFGTSAAADDLTAGFSTGSVTFAPGDSTAVVSVQIAPDITVEPDEKVQLSLQTVTGGAFGSPIEAIASILDDDQPTVSITRTVNAIEGTTNLFPNALAFDLTRTGNLSTATTVTLSISGGTAQANDVYYQDAAGLLIPGFGSETVTFAAGQATASVPVYIQADSVIEPDETVALTLTGVTGGRIGATSTALATILDDDHRSIVSIVSVDNAAEGTPPGPGGIATFHLTRTGDLTDAPTVSYSISGGTATADDVQGGFYDGTVTFAIGQRDATVAVQWVPDSNPEPNETVNLTLTGVSGGLVGAASQRAATIIDDDIPPPSVIIMSERNQAVLEGTAPGAGGIFTFTIHRIGDLPDQQVVSYIIEGTAIRLNSPLGGPAYTTPATADDFQGGFGAGIVTLAPGQQDATVTIQANPDAVLEDDETFQLRLTGVTGGTPGATLGQVVYDPFGHATDNQVQDGATLLNDDAAGAAPCYCPGTMIMTDRGEVPVEALCIGDRVVTERGRAEPIRWIGRRCYDGRFIAGNPLMLPVTIRAGALGDGVPHTDLHVSPGHALWVDGQLVPAWRLVNGVSVTQSETVDTVTYLHIELHRHALLLANGAPAESFLDESGMRGQFHNAAGFRSLYPEAAAMAPLQARLEDGFALQRIQARLADRAGLPTSVEPAGVLRGFIDRAGPDVVCGWAQDCDSPEEPVTLEISVDGAPFLSVLANGWRADLRRAGMGSGCHAFEAGLPQGAAGPISIRRVTDGSILGYTDTARRAERRAG